MERNGKKYRLCTLLHMYTFIAYRTQFRIQFLRLEINKNYTNNCECIQHTIYYTDVLYVVYICLFAVYNMHFLFNTHKYYYYA